MSAANWLGVAIIVAIFAAFIVGITWLMVTEEGWWIAAGFWTFMVALFGLIALASWLVES